MLARWMFPCGVLGQTNLAGQGACGLGLAYGQDATVRDWSLLEVCPGESFTESSFPTTGSAPTGRGALAWVSMRKRRLQQRLNGGRWELVAEFVEIESGKRARRPQLDAALAACKKHKAKLVVAKLDLATCPSC